MKGNDSRPGVLITFPKFSGFPYLLFPKISTRKMSDPPKVPGISDAKYRYFSSGLKAGCATLY